MPPVRFVWLVQESNSRGITRFQPWTPLNAAPQSVGYNPLRPRMSPDIVTENRKRGEIGKRPMNPYSCVKSGPSDRPPRDSSAT